MLTTRTLVLIAASAAALFILTLAGACGGDRGDRAVAATLSADADWHRQVLYLAVTDRFANGDARNDDAGSPGCHDPADPQKFHGGDFAGLRAHLDYLQSFGATALWITPAYQQIARLGNNHCGYHGYWADYTFPDDGAVEPKLGSADELRGLVDDLHARGMRFILDLVVNHTGDTARLPRQKPGWFHDPSTCASLGDPTIDCPLDGHPDFAQEQPEVAGYLDAVSAGWARRFAVDGIRMDTARHVPPSYFRDHFLPAVHADSAHRFTVAEVFQEGGAAAFLPVLDAGFDSVFNFPLRRAFVDAFAHGRSVDEVAGVVRDDLGTLGLARTLMLVNLVDNHDVRRFVDEPGFGVPEDEIRSRYLLALGALFTLPGIPQLYYGDELGLWGGTDPDNRRDLPAWAFDPAQRSVRHAGRAVAGADVIFARVHQLAALRQDNRALTDGDYTELWRQNGGRANVLAFARTAGASRIVVALNAGADPSGALPLHVDGKRFPDGTVFDELLGAGAPTTLRVAGGRLPIALPGRTMGVWRAR
jgi:glycosidase